MKDRWVIFRAVAVVMLCLLPLITLGYVTGAGWVWNHSAFISPDEFSYILTAEHIGAGKGVVLEGLDNFYPPGLPALLAAWGTCFGFSLISLHVAVAVIQCVAAGVIYGVVKALWKGSPWIPVLVLLGYVSSWHVLENTMSIFSEGAFTLVVFVWLAVAIRWPRWFENWRLALLMAVLAVAATAMRSAGIVCAGLTLVWPWIVWAKGWWRGRSELLVQRAVVASVIGIVVVIGWYAALAVMSPEKSILQTKGHNSYTMQLLRGLSKPEDFAHNLEMHFDDWAQSFVPPMRETPRFGPYNVITRLIFLLALWGWLGQLIWDTPERMRFVAWFVLVYAGLYLLWPFDFVRFWIPILPLMLLYIVLGLERIRSCELRMAAVALPFGAMLILNGYEIATHLVKYETRIDYVSDCLSRSAAAIGQAGGDPARDVMLSNEPFTFRYYTRMREVDLPWPDPPGKAVEEIAAEARKNGRAFTASYFSDRLYLPLMQAVEEKGMKVTRIYHADMVSVWKVEQ